MTVLPIPDRVVLYDGVCNLCNDSVKFIIQRDPAAKFSFAPMQEAAGHELLRQHGLEHLDLSTFVLIREGRAYLRSSAWLQIVGDLDGAWPVLTVFRIVPRFIRDAVYDFIGKRRYRWFGKQEMCLVPTADTRKRFLRWEPAA